MAETPPSTVKPRLVKGFRDIMPHQVVGRRRMIETIRAAFERFGFVPLDTPAVEHVDALVGLGEEGTKNLFRMQSPEGEEIALRYDLTVPLARLVAQYPDLPRPLRRYQIASVWRADKPDPGRFREFIQFDIDSVGAPSVLADTEILMAMDQALRDLGVRFLIRFSSRKLLNVLLRKAGVSEERGSATLRVLDKLERLGLEGVLEELGDGRVDASGDRIPGLRLAPSSIETIAAFLDLALQASPTAVREGEGPAPRGAVIERLGRFLGGAGGALEALAELREIDAYLRAARVPDERVVVDASIARGLDYYTGPVFEASLPELPRYGAIFGGGRYDGLVERFLGVKVPATGASIGVDRLLAALDELGRLESGWSTARVLVTVMDRERLPDYLEIAREIREASVNVEVYMGEATSLKKQMAYADKVGIPVVIIAGSNEFDSGTVSIKDLREGKKHEADASTRQEWVKRRFGQQEVPRSGMIGAVRSLLGEA